jgi:hypothetical protein
MVRMGSSPQEKSSTMLLASLDESTMFDVLESI